MQNIYLDKDRLSIDEVVAIARHGAVVKASAQGEVRVERARALIARWVREQRVIYGITTGFGAFKDKLIPPDQARELQRNIIMSHAVGVGAPWTHRRREMNMHARPITDGVDWVGVVDWDRRLFDELDSPGLYHFEAWKDDPDGLVAEFVKLQDFYRQAAARGLAIVFYSA